VPTLVSHASQTEAATYSKLNGITLHPARPLHKTNTSLNVLVQMKE